MHPYAIVHTGALHSYVLHMDTLHSGCVCVLCSMRLLPVVSCVKTQNGGKGLRSLGQKEKYFIEILFLCWKKLL